MSNMVVQTNVMALNGHRNLSIVGQNQQKASQKLSSGYRINSAADDAAGLAISEKMRAQIRGLDMASKNTQDGISMIQTAEGGMQEIDNMLQRIRELVDQNSNDTNEANFTGSGDRTKIQDEINQLVQEIDSMSERVEFNKKKILNGSYADVSLQIATTSAQRNIYSLNADDAAVTSWRSSADGYRASVAAIEAQAASVGAGIDYAKAIGASTASAIDQANSINNDLVAAQTRLASAEKLYEVTHTMNLELRALSTTKVGLSTLNDQVTGTLHFQIGANANQSLYLNIGSFKSDILGIGDGKGNCSINLNQDTGADTTGYLAVLDRALSYVTTERSKLGAAQNRLEYTQKSLDVSSENLSSAESRIRDADMAKEMMSFTKANVLQQAAVSMLSQANQQPQNVLQLLR